MEVVPQGIPPELAAVQGSLVRRADQRRYVPWIQQRMEFFCSNQKNLEPLSKKSPNWSKIDQNRAKVAFFRLETKTNCYSGLVHTSCSRNHKQ